VRLDARLFGPSLTSARFAREKGGNACDFEQQWRIEAESGSSRLCVERSRPRQIKAGRYAQQRRCGQEWNFCAQASAMARTSSSLGLKHNPKPKTKLHRIGTISRSKVKNGSTSGLGLARPRECSLTLHSSGAPTAWRTAWQVQGLRPILHLPVSAPRCRAPLNSNVRPHWHCLCSANFFLDTFTSNQRVKDSANIALNMTQNHSAPTQVERLRTAMSAVLINGRGTNLRKQHRGVCTL
jgi:hypothetical protein